MRDRTMTHVKKLPPGPTSTRDYDLVNLHRSLVNHKQLYGDISYFNIKGKSIVCLNSVAMMREGLNSDALKDRAESFSQKYILVGDVTVQSYSEDWARLHEAMLAGIKVLVNPTDDMIVTQNAEFSVMKSKLREMHDSPFDPRDIIWYSVVNEMLIGLLGQRFEYDHDIFKCYQQFDNNGMYLYTDLKANYILGKLPWLRHLCCGYGRKFKLTNRAIKGLARYLLHEAKRDEQLSKQGMVYEMLRAQRQDNKLTDSQIMAALVDMHISGNLATCAAIFSIIYQLICHPDVQRKIHEEIDSVIGGDTQVTSDHLKDLPYTHATMLEVFRQCPVFFAAFRGCKSEATIGGYTFPANTRFLGNIFCVNHDEEMWKEPWTFDPQRFIDDDGKLVAADNPIRQKLILYGEGLRGCPGEDYATKRILLLLVNLLQSFEVRHNEPTSDDSPMKYTFRVFLYPPPFKVILRERCLDKPSA